MSEIRVMTYNIGHYNMGLSEAGFPAPILNEKLTNLKEMLMSTGPDIIGIQEDAHYIDQAGTKKSPDNVYAPVWTFHDGYKAETIKAKYKLISGTYELVAFSNGQHYRRGCFAVNGKKLLFVSCHTIAHVGNSAKRKIQYTELFDYVRSAQWDYCVITGDFNTTEKTDKENLKTMCEANKFAMAIGQYLPWVDTYLGRTPEATKHSFDNILVSPNITIKTTTVMRDWYSRLYSDHVPVVADLILK